MAFDDNRRQPAPRQQRAARIETHANGANRTTNGWTDRRRTDGRCELCASKTSAANRRRKRGPRSAGHHCVVGGQSVAHSRRENLESGIDQRSGLAVHSLYTVTAIAPPDSLLRDIDALVFDLQDIGVRTWTYVGSMIYAMRAAARRQLPIVVLDRPNPLTGDHVDGPTLDTGLANANEHTARRSAKPYALYPFPLRHGMTMGEMALFYNSVLGINAPLRVVPMSG